MKKTHLIDSYKRRSVFTQLKPFCHFAKDDGFIEVTEWINSEGFDVQIGSVKNESFRLTWGEFDALKKLVKQLDRNAETEMEERIKNKEK